MQECSVWSNKKSERAEGRLQKTHGSRTAGMVCQTLLFSLSCDASIKLISRRGWLCYTASPGMTDTFKEVD